MYFVKTVFCLITDCSGHFSHWGHCYDDICRWFPQPFCDWHLPCGCVCINSSNIQSKRGLYTVAQQTHLRLSYTIDLYFKWTFNYFILSSAVQKMHKSTCFLRFCSSLFWVMQSWVKQQCILQSSAELIWSSLALYL